MGFRFLIAVLLMSLAWAAPARALSLEDARHLLARTGFGTAEPDMVRQILPLSREQAVDLLIDGIRTGAITPPPAWIGEPPPDPRMVKALPPEDRKALRQKMGERARDLKAWWIEEMLVTPSPLTERLVLFWHNHFTSSLKKVKWPAALYAQNLMFRHLGSADFGHLLMAVATDPAMLVYLDGRANRAGEPNENFARELLELFTLGEGHSYSETDIREAARALTGWTVEPATGRARFAPRRFDAGVKTFLGYQGRLGAEDVMEIILGQHRTAEYLVEKFWRAFVNDQPDIAQVKFLAAGFRNSGYAIRPLLRRLFLTEAFWAPANRGVLVKSPVDVVVGTLRLVGLRPDNGPALAHAVNALGQDLFNPPNVKGWPGGNAWITATSLPLRRQMLTRLTQGVEMAARRGPDGMKARPVALALDAFGPPTEMSRLLLALPPDSLPAPGTAPQDAFRQLILDPRFQLK